MQGWFTIAIALLTRADPGFPRGGWHQALRFGQKSIIWPYFQIFAKTA